MTTRTLSTVAVLVGLVQAVLALRVATRLLRTARGIRIPVAPASSGGGRVSVVVPVLDEERRLGPCLAGLSAQGPVVAEILVVDGGCGDGTEGVVRAAASRDQRVRWVAAGQAAIGTNGKAHNLAAGLAASAPSSEWLLTIDADVRPAPALVDSLVAFAERSAVDALSVATDQLLSGAAEAIVHPAMLATLVYRYGIPGAATANVAGVQANGQCFLVRRSVLECAGGFAPLHDSICEDVTLARTIANLGYEVGFYGTDHLAAVEMYEGWREAWVGWSRSLPMRDPFWGWPGWVGLLEVLFVQALPLPIAALMRRPFPKRGLLDALRGLNLALVAMRLGVLVGSARAYPWRPPTLWLSPLGDLPVACTLLWSAARRRHVWRGRPIVRGGFE